MVENRDGRTPGELLQEARDARRMTLEQLAAETKIPQRLLQALERDEYHLVSGSLYIKSFLRAFAEAVGLDPGEIVTLYELGRGQAVSAPEATDAIWQDGDTEVRKVGVAYGRWLRRWGAPLLLLIAAAVWWFVLREAPKNTETTGDRSAIESLLADDEGSGHDTASPETVRSEPPSGSVAGSDADSLASGWLAEAVAEPTATEAVPVEAQVSWQAEPDPTLPPARRGDQRVEFSDGRTRPLVLRLLCSAPMDVGVAIDGIAEPSPVLWPTNARPGRLPAARIVAGQPYSVRQGVVIYWGADDHFNLQLGHCEGIELTLNGRALETGAWRPNQLILIDGDSASASPDR